MDNLRLFVGALLRKWWALMSCAVFTFIGLIALVFNLSNRWIIAASFAAAVCLFFVAAFFAWNQQRKEVISKDLEISRLSRIDCPIVSVYLWQAIGSGITENLAWGFYFRNNGKSPAYEITVRGFLVGSQSIKCGNLNEVLAECSSDPIPVWIEGVQQAPDKWNLMAAFNEASKATDGESPYGRPNFSITLHIFYRDHRNLWYESVQDLVFVPATGNFHFKYGATEQNYLGTNRPDA